MDREMMRALEADGEKLRAITGEDHGPWFDDGVQRDMRLDTPIGAKVIFVARGGYDAERALAEKVLTVGRAYTVSAIDIGGFTSTVTIDGLGSFNTVMFRNAPATPQNPQTGE